jgi:hypothetical protein
MKESIQVVNDQWGCPTFSHDLAKAVALLMEVDARGIFHVCNRGKATWYDLACKAIEYVGLGTRVVPWIRLHSPVRHNDPFIPYFLRKNSRKNGKGHAPVASLPGDAPSGTPPACKRLGIGSFPYLRQRGSMHGESLAGVRIFE